MDNLLTYQQEVTEKLARYKAKFVRGKMVILFVYGCCVLYGDSDLIYNRPLIAATSIILTFNYVLVFSASLILGFIVSRMTQDSLSMSFVIFEFATYIYMPVITVLSAICLYSSIALGRLGLSIYFSTAILLYTASMLCEVFELCCIEDLVTDHIVYMDRKNYIIDHDWLEGIRREVKDDMKKIRQDKMLEMSEINPRMFGDSVYQIYAANMKATQDSETRNHLKVAINRDV